MRSTLGELQTRSLTHSIDDRPRELVGNSNRHLECVWPSASPRQQSVYEPSSPKMGQTVDVAGTPSAIRWMRSEARLDFRHYAVASKSFAQEWAEFWVAGSGNGGAEK